MRQIILVALCLLAGFSITLTAALIHFSVYWGFSQRMKQEAATELEYAGAGINAAGKSYLDSLAFQPAFATEKPRLTLIAPDGAILFDNMRDAEKMENHSARPEFQEALAGKTGENFRFSKTLEEQTYYRAILLNNGSVLRIAVSMDSITASALDMLPLTMVIVLVIFICAVISASKITRMIVKPINSINLEIPEENDIYDELSPLLSRIKAQRDQLEKQIAKLRKRQLEFEAITNNMREGLVLLDKEGRVLLSSQSALKLLRINSAIPENQNALYLRRDEPFRLALEKVLSGEHIECLLSVESARLLLMASPVMDGGKMQGAALLLLDVTEQEERERLRREFSANVSHELKTPLTVISGYAEILSQSMANPEDAPGFGGKIYAESQRLLNLINDVMQLSRLDEGAVNLEREPVNLYTLVSGVVERAAPIARSRNIRLSLTGEDAIINGIPQILHEMAFNLVDNGIKYNNDGGEVRVSITSNEKTVCLCVADNGAGIPLVEQERVFERFYRVDKSRNTGTGGTGLGLSIVKHGAQLHDANIELESG
ncbi:MAG: two-component sensor histidine kinase, partial [Spirochaetaceae bacterium]|nr:two-component sensor histidine kinase [Spirochaetaceae bacterium]